MCMKIGLYKVSVVSFSSFVFFSQTRCIPFYYRRIVDLNGLRGMTSIRVVLPLPRGVVDLRFPLS